MGDATTRAERQADHAVPETRQRALTETEPRHQNPEAKLAARLPASLSPAQVILLQRAAGNSAVADLLLQSRTMQRAEAPAAVAEPPAAEREREESGPEPQKAASAQAAQSPFGQLLKGAPPGAGEARQAAAQPARPKPPPPPLVQNAAPERKQAPMPGTEVKAGRASEIAADASQAPAVPQAAPKSGPALAGPAAPQPPPAPAGGSASLLRLHQFAATRRAQLLAQADARAILIRDAASAVKLRVKADHSAEGWEVGHTFDQSIAQIKASQQNAKTEIASNRDAKVAEVEKAAVTELANLEKTIPEKQAAMRAAGASRRQAATAFGDQEAQRAVAECNKKAEDAITIGERKAAAYMSRERGGEMGAEAKRMAGDAAKQVREAGTAIASEARDDALTLGTKFTDEANEAAATFTDGLPAARKKIEQERDHTVAGLKDMAQQALGQLEKAGSDTIASLEQQRAGVTKQSNLSGDGAAAALDDAAERAIANHQAHTLQMCSDLDQFTAGIGERTASDEDVDQAGEYLASVLDEFDGASLKFVGNSGKAFEGGGSAAKDRTKAQLAPLLDPVRNTATNFEAQSAKASGDVVKKMGEATTQSVTTMRTTVTDVGADLQKSIDESSANWDKQLADGKAEITTKVNKGIDEQTKLVDGLPAKIEERAQEIADRTWLSSALSFLGGVLLGFLKALAIAVLIILAIAIVVVLIVLFVAYVVPGGLGIILAAAIFITVNAAAIAAVLEVVGFLVALVIVALAIYKLYEAKTRDDLSPEQRGELVGGALFDIVTVIFGEAIVGKLVKWLRMRPPVLPDAPPRLPGEPPVLDPIPVDPAVRPPVQDVAPAVEPVRPAAEPAAAARVADPEQFGRAVAADVRGQKGVFYTIADRITAAKLSQADAVKAVEGATMELGNRLTTVQMGDGTVVVSSVMPGSGMPVIVVRPDGSVFYGSADLAVDPSDLANPLRITNVRPRGPGTAAAPAAGIKAADDLTKAPEPVRPAGGTATATATAREVTTTPVQLQSKFKHAPDFGISGNYNPENAKAFDAAITAHVQSPDVQLVEGSYRGDPARIFVNPKTGVAVITTPSGEFVSGWKLNPQQLQSVLTTGNLGGG